MKTVAELRKDIYDYHRKYYSYIFEQWKWYSYRKLKARMYMDVAPLLVCLFIKAKIRPNTVTTAYGIMGIIGGIFLAIPIKWFILTGIILFYFRPFLDWSDGLLARETKQTSISGAVLDPYGAGVGWVFLWAGLGLYLAAKSGEVIFFYLTPVIPIMLAVSMLPFIKAILYDDFVIQGIRDYLSNRQNQVPCQTNADVVTKHPGAAKMVRFIERRFEHNAGFVDLICLIILLELFLPIFISWVIYLAFLLWRIVFFVAGYYMVDKGGWVENELQNKLNQIC